MITAKCKSCGADIVWAKTNTSKMPMDAKPVPGLFRLAPPTLQVDPDGAPLAVPVRVYQSHFATCPHADQHRRKK